MGDRNDWLLAAGVLPLFLWYAFWAPGGSPLGAVLIASGSFAGAWWGHRKHNRI